MALLGVVLPRAATSTQPTKKTLIKLTGENNSFLKLQEGREVQSNYEAMPATVLSAMRAGGLKPLTLAPGDLNRDGFPDLLCGYSSSGGGLVTLYRGDPKAFAPSDPNVINAITQGVYPDPFLKETLAYDLPSAPDFLSSGDFNKDGRIDVIAASRGGQTLYLLEGQEGGGFSQPLWIPLNGWVTSMFTGGFNSRDGLDDIIIGIDSLAGPSLQVYDGMRSVLETEPKTFALPAKASSLALGKLDDDLMDDLAILADGQVFILHASSKGGENVSASKKAGKLETVESQFRVRAIALGEFIWDRDGRTEIAMLSDDGTVHVVTRGELDTRPWTAEEIAESRRQMARVREKAERARQRGEQPAPMALNPNEPVDWTIAEDFPTASTGSGAAPSIASADSSQSPILLSTRISALPSDDLLLLNSGSRAIELSYREEAKKGDSAPSIQSAKRSTVALESDDDIAAVLPMRVSVDGRPGLVVLSKGKTSPDFIIAAASATFTVTRSDDPAPGACAVGDCSLREAVIAANAAAGADNIVFNPGVNPVLTITGSDNAASLGDLDINDSVTITGNPTTINTTYASGCGDCKVFGVNQSGTFTGLTVNFTNVTIQNGFNDHVATGSFQETGGGIDFFLTGTGVNYSMTGCTVTSNEARTQVQSYGGGINIDSGSPVMTNHGSVTFTNTTISSNTADATGGGLNLFSDIHNVTFTGCTITGNTTLATGGLGAQGGGIKLRHTNGGTVVIQGNTMFTNNTAKGNGGALDYVTGNTAITFTIDSTTVSGNTSQSAGTGSSVGGGLSLSGNAMLTAVTVTNNHSDQSASGTSLAGGVFVSGGTVSMNNTCSITNNTSNGTNGKGGGVAMNGGILNLTGVTVNGNQAAGDGGGFNVNGTGPSPGNAQLNFTNGSITANSAANGGALTTDSTSTGAVVLNGVSITNNTATTDTGGIFQRGSATSTISINGITFTGNTSPTIKVGGGTTSTVGTVNVDNGITIAGGTLNAGSSSVNIGGTFTLSSGTFTSGTSTFTFNGTGAQGINGASSPGFNNLIMDKSAGTLTLGVNITEAGNLTLTNGIMDLSTFTANRTAAGGTLTLSNASTMKIGGTNTLPSNFNAHSISATSTIDYSGTSQNVATLNSSQKYGNLVTSGSGTKTLAGAISIATSLTIGASTTLDASASNFNINDAGNWTNNGTFNPRSATVTFDGSSGTQALAGNTTFFNLTLNNSGATTAFGATSTTIGSNLVTTAGTMNGGTSTITFTGNPGSISGANAKNFNNLVINNGAVVSNTTGGNTNISNEYTNNGTFTQAATLTTTFNTGADGNHSFSGSGTTTFGNVTINGSNTVDAGSHNFNVVGASFTVTGTFTGNTSTATFNGSAAQAILGNGTKNFAGLTSNNATGVTVNNTTPAVDASVSGALTLMTDLTVASGAILQQSGTSAGGADVLGTVRRTDLGTTARAFGNPNVSIAIDTGTAPTQMDIDLVKTAPGAFLTAVTRTYTLTPTGGAGISATVKLHYLNADLNGNTETKLGLWKDVAGVYVVQGRTGAVDTVNKAVSLSGVNSFSTWTLADIADVTVSVSPTSVLEDSGTAMVYMFSRTGPTTQSLLVNFSVGGTATPPGGATPDYGQTGADTFTTTTGTVTIPGGSATAAVNITPTTDTTVEPDETVILTLTEGTYNIAVPSAATGTITNDDADVSVAVSPASVTEDGGTNLVYTFTRVGATAGALTVNFSIGGTATFSTDYTQTGADTFTPPTGTVTFGAGNTTALVTVDPSADNAVEGDETVILTVTAGTGYNVGAPAAATGTITNDDADVSVAVATSAGPGNSVLEDGATNLVFTFTRTEFTGASLTINFTVGGTAAFSTDYTQTGAATFTPTTGTVTFTGTNTTAAVTIDPSVDATGEADETVILTVVAGTGYTPAAPTSATGTILNDDTQVSVAVTPTSVDEDGGTNMVYAFSRTGDTSASLLVNFTVTGTATLSSDYTQTGADSFTATTGTIAIASGSSTASLTIDPSPDTTVELDETVILTVAAGTGYVPAAPTSATGTIVNDDTDVTVAVAPTSAAEDGVGNLVYTFTRSGVTTNAITVNFSVAGTATFSTDYTQTGADTFTASAGTVTIGSGNTTAVVTVDPSADSTVEPDETVILMVTAGTGYNVGTPDAAIGTIENDDTDVTLTLTPSSVAEGAGTPLVYTFTRSGATSSSLTVNFSVSGSAIFTTDYTQSGAATFGAGSGTVTITVGNTTADVMLTPVNDVDVEGSETAALAITAGSYGIGTPNSATGTITDNDSATVAFSSSSSNAPETVGTHNVGVTLTITANGTGTPTLARDVMVNIQDLTTGTATGGGTDYTYSPNPKTLTFGFGSTSGAVQNASIPIVNDNASEGNETINLSLNTLVDGTSGQVSIVSPTSHTVTIVDNDIDLRVTKTESADPVAAGAGSGNLVYTVKVKNVGLTVANGVTMSESITIPAGVTIDTVVVSSGTLSGTNPYSWDIGTLAVNAEVTLTATLTVGAGASAGTNVICDTASITASTENRVNTSDDSAMECTSIVAQADLEITSKTDTPDPACVLGDITYAIAFQNNGPGPGLSTMVTDAVPANTTFVSAMVTSGTGWGITSPGVGMTGNVVFTKASVGVGETATFQVVVKINAGTTSGTVITNIASASSTLLDPTPGNNSKQAMTTVDPTPPTLSCPANVTAITNPNVCMQGRCATVNYATPAAIDNCPGVQVVCVPPSGTCMPTGSTTVTCTATDAAGNTANCSFSVIVFDVCLQDDSNSNTVLLFNSQTGAYKFCCQGTVYTGTGTVSVRGCVITLSHNNANRRLTASIDKTQFKGTASLQSPPGVIKCTIMDKDTRNNSCNCN
jgi:hypothetical protein